jgi:hypothetical protein
MVIYYYFIWNCILIISIYYIFIYIEIFESDNVYNYENFQIKLMK